MTVKTYLEMLNKPMDITFIKARARKDANTPRYHTEYQTTPLLSRIECKKEAILADYIILSDKQRPIDWLCAAPWDRPWVLCLLVISPDDLALLYPNEEQRNGIIKDVDSKLSNELLIKIKKGVTS